MRKPAHEPEEGFMFQQDATIENEMLALWK